MKTFSARDVISRNVVYTQGELRISDIILQIINVEATHAVVFENDAIVGILPLRTLLTYNTQRIFADMLGGREAPIFVGESSTLTDIGGVMSSARVDAVGLNAEDGTFLGIITSASLFNALLTQAREQLSHINTLRLREERLRILGQMTCGLAHDLNNILQPILGQLELLQLELLHKNIHYKRLDMALTAVLDAADTVRRLQVFYREGTHTETGEPVDLSQLVQQVRELSVTKWRNEARQQGKTIAFHVATEDVPSIMGNPGQLRELMMNLVFNAVDAIRNEGQIELKTYQLENAVILEVNDTGEGMSEEIQQRCFEPFYTTKGEYGTGVGLSICREIVAAHEGVITIVSEPGRGAGFRISFPFGKTVESPPAAPQQAAAAGYRILVIDDDRYSRHTVQEMLSHLGHQADTTHSGECGIEMASSGNYDLIFTDMSMPSPNGLEVVREIKESKPDMPVVLFTGWPEKLTTEMGRIGTAPDFVLLKPFSLEKLESAITGIQQQTVPS